MTTPERREMRLQLLAHEGDEPYLYDDATGKRIRKGDTVKGNATIGVGYNLSAKPLSARVRSLMLDECIDECLNDLHAFPWFLTLDPVRIRAVIDLRFNLGKAGLRGFPKFLAAMNQKDYETAARELETAAWYHQVQPPRARRIVAEIRTGKDPDA